MSRVRRWVPLLAVGLLVLGAAVLLAQPPSSEEPLHPSSAEASGTKAVVDILRALGAQVDVGEGLPSAEDDVALLLVDELDDADREELREWVRAGGRLVVTDPQSPLSPPSVGTTAIGLLDAPVPRRCDVAALADVDRVDSGISSTYAIPSDASGCFRRGEGAWLVVDELGEGVVVSTGGPGFLTNAGIGAADNAVLAAALLAPSEGTRVQFVQPPPPGSGDDTLVDLVPPAVTLAVVQLVVAFAVLALHRAWRLGRPLSEPQPVAIPGSELVVAVGGLLQQARARDRAAAMLRDDLRRDLAGRLGLPPDLDDEPLAQAVADRTPVAAAQVAALLRRRPGSDGELVDLAREVEDLRRAALKPSGRKPEQEELWNHV